jgi:hypothetical protein
MTMKSSPLHSLSSISLQQDAKVTAWCLLRVPPFTYRVQERNGSCFYASLYALMVAWFPTYTRTRFSNGYSDIITLFNRFLLGLRRNDGPSVVELDSEVTAIADWLLQRFCETGTFVDRISKLRESIIKSVHLPSTDTATQHATH